MRVPVILATIFAVAVAATVPAWAESKGSGSLGMKSSEMQSVMKGWSAKDTVMGKDVYNDKNEKIGTVDDIILSKDMKATYGVIDVGGFLGMGAHSVAVPIKQLKMQQDKIVLPGANKDALKKMPEFRYHEKADDKPGEK